MLIVRTLFIAVVSAAACDYKPRNHGHSLYVQHCQHCHMEQGQGLGGLMPPISNADFVREQSENLACIIRHGMKGQIIVNGVRYEGEMPGNPKLSDVEINNLVHYIMRDLNHMEDTYAIGVITEQLRACLANR